MCLQLKTGRGHNRRLARIRVADEKGQELVEAAFVISALLTLLIGIVWFGRAYNIYETITRAAREGARFAVARSCATCGNARPSDDEVRAVINAALTASSLSPSLVTPSPIAIQWGVTLNPGTTPPETGVVISFSYPLQVFVPFTTIHFTNISVSTSVQMREEI